MIGKKVLIPRYKEGDIVELIYFYRITDTGNERLCFENCVRLIKSKMAAVSEIGVIKQWVAIQEVINYGDDKYGYVGSANLHTNKLNIVVAHNQYPNYEYQIKDMDVWKVFRLSLTRGCKPTEFLYETLEIVKENALSKRNIPKSFLKKIFD